MCWWLEEHSNGGSKLSGRLRWQKDVFGGTWQIYIFSSFIHTQHLSLYLHRIRQPIRLCDNKWSISSDHYWVEGDIEHICKAMHFNEPMIVRWLRWWLLMTGTGGNDCLTTVEHICPRSSQPFNVPLDAFITSHFASEADHISYIWSSVFPGRCLGLPSSWPSSWQRRPPARQRSADLGRWGWCPTTSGATEFNSLTWL